MTRSQPSAQLTRSGVIAVLRAPHANQYEPVVEALLNGGVTCIELTLSTYGVFDELPRLIDRFGEAVDWGVGTVTKTEEARAAIGVGARYIVTPIADSSVVDAVLAQGIPIYPGGLTATELFANWHCGATAVKLFPAATVGASYLSQLRGPFPDMKVIPSGGIGLGDIPVWVRAGALAVSLGGPLIQDAFAGGDLTALAYRAEAAVLAVRTARAE